MNKKTKKMEKNRNIIKDKYLVGNPVTGFNYFDALIDQIGDEYLHDTLFDMINQMREISFSERRIKEYENKIARLRNEKN